MKQLEFPFVQEGALYLYNKHQLDFIKGQWISKKSHPIYGHGIPEYRVFKNNFIENGGAEHFAKKWTDFYFKDTVELQTEEAKFKFETNSLTLDKIIKGN
jgi:hypothetical protein